MSKDGYYGDFGSLEEEQRAFWEYNNKIAESQEPDVVPCFKCGGQMYEESDDPRLNFCEECKKKKLTKGTI